MRMEALSALLTVGGLREHLVGALRPAADELLQLPSLRCEFCGSKRLQGGEGGCPDDDCEYWEESAAWPAQSSQRLREAAERYKKMKGG